MGELEDKISSLLSNPDALEQVMKTVRALVSDKAEKPGPEPDAQAGALAHAEPGNLLGLISALGGGKDGSSPLAGIDPKIISMAIKLLGTYSSQDSRQTALLMALRPYVRSQRCEKIDNAVQMVKIARVAKQALSGLMGGVGDV